MISFDVEGVDELIRKVEDALEETTSDIVEEALKRTTVLTPVDTGDLKAGWYTEQDKYAGWVINDVDYASFVEYGHMTSNESWFVPGVFMGKLGIDYAIKKAQSFFDANIEKRGIK